MLKKILCFLIINTQKMYAGTIPALQTSAATSRCVSDMNAWGNISLGQSSGANTPPTGHLPEPDGAPEVVSTPQPPSTHMKFDTLEEAEKHYKMYAWRKGFGIRYNYRKTSEVTGEYIRAAIVCHKAGQQSKEKEDP
jgi:hypothetical protein